MLKIIVRDGPLFFIGGEEGGVSFLGLGDNFFLKSSVFQTIFFITFCNGNNFLQLFFKNVTGSFYSSYLK